MCIAMFVAGLNPSSALIASAVAAAVSLSARVPTGWVGQVCSAPLALAGWPGSRQSSFSMPPGPGRLSADRAGHHPGGRGCRHTCGANSGMSLVIATLAAAAAIEELLLKWGWSIGVVRRRVNMMKPETKPPEVGSRGAQETSAGLPTSAQLVSGLGERS